jgi:ABC-type antimicrobial peptide transport system permease subunit
VSYSRNVEFKCGIYGVTPSLFKASHHELMEVNYFNPNSSLDIVEQLYTARGSQGMGVGHLVPKRMGLDLTDKEDQIILELVSKVKNSMHVLRPLFTMNMAPGFTMIDNDVFVKRDQAILVSLPIYATLGRLRINEIPFERLIIRLKEYDNPDHLKQIKKALEMQLEATGHAKQYLIRDSFEDQKPLRDVEFILQMIFTAIIPITMFLCFFSLSSSMTANLYEQCKDLAILRAVGFKANSVVKIYTYEAFILITSSAVIGIFIGTFLGWMVAL